MKITVWSHIEVKEIPSTQRLYKSVGYFGGVYNKGIKIRPQQVTHLLLEVM